MMLPSLSRIEEHAFFILFIAFIIVLFWFGCWELVNTSVEHLHQRHGIAKWKISVVIILFVILMIGFFPRILQKI